MKLFVAVLVCYLATANARTIEVDDKAGIALSLPCRSADIGNRYPNFLNPHGYYECTSQGLKARRCSSGLWYKERCQDCVKLTQLIGNKCPVAPEPEKPVSSEEVVPEPEQSSEEVVPEPEQSSSSSSSSSEEAVPEPEQSSEEAVPEPEQSSEEEVPEPEPEEPETEPEQSSEEAVPEPEQSSEEAVPEPEQSSSEEEEPIPEPVESSEEEAVPEPTEAPSSEEEQTDAPVESSSEEEQTDAPVESSSSEEEPIPEPSSEEGPIPEPSSEEESCEVVCNPGDHYLVDPESCGHFYQCSNGVAYNMPCPAGLVFNPNVRPGPVCDWPSAYHCVGKPGCQPQPEEPKNDCDSIKCNLEDLEDMYHAHPSRCDAFCQCSNGTPHHMDCPSGLHFNTELNVCDWPQAANCQVGKK